MKNYNNNNWDNINNIVSYLKPTAKVIYIFNIINI